MKGDIQREVKTEKKKIQPMNDNVYKVIERQKKNATNKKKVKSSILLELAKD